MSASPASPAAQLMDRLGLSDDELCEVLAVDPLAILSNDLAHRPELQILLDLTAEAAAQVGDGLLRRWLRRRAREACRSNTCARATSPPSRTTWRRSPSAASS